MHFFWSGGCPSVEPVGADGTGIEVAQERAAGRAGRVGVTGGGGGNGGVAEGARAPGPASESAMAKVDAMAMEGAGATGKSVEAGWWTGCSASEGAAATGSATRGRLKFSANRSGWSRL